jgi:uncharacterized membrane protein
MNHAAMTEYSSISSCKWIAKIRSLLQGQSGAVAVYVGVTIPLFVGAAGLAVDLTSWYRAKRNIQSAADAAAYAAALNLAQQGLDEAPDMTAIQVAADDAAARNGVSAPVIINSPPTSGLAAGDPQSIEVIATDPAPMFFAGSFLDAEPQIAARSVAKRWWPTPASGRSIPPREGRSP